VQAGPRNVDLARTKSKEPAIKEGGNREGGRGDQEGRGGNREGGGGHQGEERTVREEVGIKERREP
jgi:hypothetical protein